MASEQWYELRAVPKFGTIEYLVGSGRDGVAIGPNGKLCTLSSGQALKFATREEALNYLGTLSVAKLYNFKAILCKRP